MHDITLTDSDPTVFARCDACATGKGRAGLGRAFGNYFGKAFTSFRWRKGQVCDNCGGPLTVVFEIAVDD